MNAAIPLSEAEWEIEGESHTSHSTQQLKKRFRYSNRESMDVRVRLKGTRLWYQLHDIDLLRPRKIGFGRRLVSLLLRSLCLIPYALIFLVSLVILAAIFSRDALIYQGNPTPPIVEFTHLKGVMTWQVGLAGVVFFAFGLLARKVQHLRAAWITIMPQEFMLYLSAVAFAACFVGYFNAVIYFVSAIQKLGSINLMWCVKVALSTAAGVFFWYLFQRLRIPKLNVKAPNWLNLDRSEIEINSAKGRSWVLAKFIQKCPGITFFMLLPGWFKLIKEIKPDATEPEAYTIIGVTGLLFCFILNQLTSFAGRLESLAPFEVLRKDPRPPVTYLRNFKADLTTAHPFGTACRELVLREICFDSVGPFIAVGKPGEWIPGIGAPRIYIQSQDREAWQSVVGRLIDGSNLVFFSAELPELRLETAGNSVPVEWSTQRKEAVESALMNGAPKGLTWELDQVLRDENVNKLVLAVGSLDFERRYRQFRRCFNAMFNGQLPEAPPRGALIVLRDGAPRVLRGRYSMVNFLGKVLGVTQGAQIFADQLFASGSVSGYTYEHKSTKNALTSPNFAFFLSAIVLATFGFSLASVTNPYLSIGVVSILLVVIWSWRLRRTIAEYGVPLKQWKPVTGYGVTDETVRSERDVIKRGQRFIIAASIILGLVMCWATYSDSQPESAFLGVGTENQNGNLVVTDVAPDSSADMAGLEAGIQILSIDGQSLSDQEELSTLIKSKSPGESCVIKIVRGGKEETLTIILSKIPEAQTSPSSSP